MIEISKDLIWIELPRFITWMTGLKTVMRIRGVWWFSWKPTDGDIKWALKSAEKLGYLDIDKTEQS